MLQTHHFQLHPPGAPWATDDAPDDRSRHFGVARAPAAGDPVAMETPEVLVGWTTLPSQEEALRIAREVVENRLAACAQVSGPITSVYRWEGRVETSAEFRVTVKFAAAREAEIGRWLAATHPYETPQWICCRAEAGMEKYLKWVVGNSS